MELALAVALAVVLFLAFSAFMARGIERERAQRLSDELLTLRRAAPAARVPVPIAAAEEAPRAEPSAAAPDRSALEAGLQQLRSALEEGRRLAAHEPPAARRSEELDRAMTLARSLEPLLAGLASSPAETGGGGEPFAGLPAPPAPLRVDASTASLDELIEELRRLGADLLAVSRADSRRGEAAGALTAALARAEILAAPLDTFHAILSGLADRVNLLALNVAVLAARPGPEGAVFQEAERELRNVYAELRRAGGELGALTQRSAEAARGARDASIDLAERSAAAEGAVAPSLDRWRRAQEKARSLAAQLDAFEAAAREGEEHTRLLESAADEARVESQRLRDTLRRAQGEVARQAAEAERAADLATRLVESIEKAQSHVSRPPAAPPLAPLLERLEAVVQTFERLDSGAPGRPH